MKVDDPTFHMKAWGGIGYGSLKYGDQLDCLIQELLWTNVHNNPTHSLQDHVALLRQQGAMDISRTFVQRIFYNWAWTWKKPVTQHLLKYTPNNIAYYAQWVSLIHHIPFTSLKFCDESHFVSRHLHRNLVISPMGQQPYQHDTADLAHSFSLTLLIDLANTTNPFFIDIRTQSNTEHDFLTFVRQAVAAGRLRQGDFFIVDNASIHFGSTTRTELLNLLHQAGVQYIFLPTYSPELNPCELVFAYIKHHIRTNRTPDRQVHLLLLDALIALPYTHLLRFYKHCTHLINRIHQ